MYSQNKKMKIEQNQKETKKNNSHSHLQWIEKKTSKVRT